MDEDAPARRGLAVVCALAIFAAAMFGLANLIGCRFASLYWGRRRAAPVDLSLRVAVILPLRGGDEGLNRCLRGLLAQDHADFDIHVVIDHSTDPACEIVSDVLNSRSGISPRVHVTHLRHFSSTCSLKISAQLQALEELRKTADVVAFLDSDAELPTHWLRTLVAPLSDPHIVATTGVRWYHPRTSEWGTLVRHFWNSASQPYMMAFGLPWGGSLALRTSLFDNAEDREGFRKCLFDDCGAANLIRRNGGRLLHLPELTIINRESTSLRDCTDFLTRQMLGPFVDMEVRYGLIALNVGVAYSILLSVAMMVAGLATRSWELSLVFAGLLAFYFGVQLTLSALVEGKIRNLLARQGTPMPTHTCPWRTAVAPLLTQGVHIYCFCRAILAESVRWRGALYRVRGHHDIHLDAYSPFVSSTRTD